MCNVYNICNACSIQKYMKSYLYKKLKYQSTVVCMVSCNLKKKKLCVSVYSHFENFHLVCLLLHYFIP